MNPTHPNTHVRRRPSRPSSLPHLGLLLAWFALPRESLGASPPRIVTQPRVAPVEIGAPARFSVEVESDTATAFQWHHERRPIPGATNAAFEITSVQSTNVGLYWVEIRNAAGRVGSDGARLHAYNSSVWATEAGGNDHRYEFLQTGWRELDWKVMLRDVRNRGGYLLSLHSPAEESFVYGAFPVTSARLMGLIQDPGSTEPGDGWRWMSGEPLTYTHWSPGEPNNGLRADRSIINPRGFENLVGVNGDGTWNDIHGGGTGYLVEYPARLVICEPPTNVVVGGNERICLRATAACARPLTYQWFVNGVLRPGSKGPELPVSEVSEDDSTCFYVASDGTNAVASAAAHVRFAPLFETTPASRVLQRGESTVLRIDVGGPGPVAYQWFKDGAPIRGATAAELGVGPAADADQGTYSVEVSNPNGAAKSPGAVVVVRPSNGTLVLFDDFEVRSHPGWSVPATTVPPAGGGRQLGEFASESVGLTLTDLSPHHRLLVSFDLILRGFWEGIWSGKNNPQTWGLAVDGIPIFRTSFAAFGSQSFPDALGLGNHPAGSGADSTNTLGYEQTFAGDYGWEDARYRITREVPHTGTTAKLIFSALMPNAAEAAWSLDNVAVFELLSSPLQLEISGTRDPAQLLLQVSSPAGAVITLAESRDLLEWRPFQIFTNTSGAKALLWPVEAGPASFVRAMITP